MKKQNSSELFKSQDIEVSCPEKMIWDEMDVVGDGRRHCEGCDKTLFDVTGYTKQEVVELQKKHGNICVAVSNTVIASSLVLSLAACSSPSVERPKEEVKQKVEEVNETIAIDDEEVITVMGIIVPPPEPIYEVMTEEKKLTQQEVYAPSVPVVVQHVTLGMPPKEIMPPRPCKNLGKRMLNNVKRFFGIEKVEYCYD